jgi:hypothetical protein
MRWHTVILQGSGYHDSCFALRRALSVRKATTRFPVKGERQPSTTISSASRRRIPALSVTIFKAGQGQLPCIFWYPWYPLTPEIGDIGWKWGKWWKLWKTRKANKDAGFQQT